MRSFAMGIGLDGLNPSYALDYDIVEPPATEESAAPHPQHSASQPAAVWKAGAKFVAKFVGGWARAKFGA